MEHNPSEDLKKIYNDNFVPIIKDLQAAVRRNPEKNFGFALVVISNQDNFLNFSIQNVNEKSLSGITREFMRINSVTTRGKFDLIYPN